MEEILIRPMRSADLDFAAACTAAEGWAGETRAQFESHFAHDPHGCLIAEASGEPLGICVATDYSDVGFVGELIVVPSARGRGLGRRLLDRALEHLHAQGARSVYLDGVVAAVPLYERAGFRKVCRSLRLAGEVAGRTAPGVRPIRPDEVDAVAALDRAAFGADRRGFLERRLRQYPDLCRVAIAGGAPAGFVLARPAGNHISAGPWVVTPALSHPTDLIAALLPPGISARVGMGILETNQPARAAADELGFSELPDPPWRMVHGQDTGLGCSPQCYAIGSAAKG